MRYQVRLERQVVDFVNARPPEFRRRVKEAFKGLATWEGDIRPLRDELEDTIGCGWIVVDFCLR
jgi:hypothetical protein